MLSKFFRNRPRKGKPLAQAGMAEGLAGMDNAWATLDCLGGSVQWSHGKPTIMPPGSSGIGNLDFVRGDKAIYKVVMLRAYASADDTLVAAGTDYDPNTMYLFPTWDWPRMR